MQSKLSGRFRRATVFAAVLLLSNALWGLCAGAEVPRRVVSANLCADQLLLALGDPDQVVSLSPYAKNPQMSFLADEARPFPTNRGSGEDLVRLQADLVLVGPYDSRYTRQLLATQKMEFMVLEPWSRFEDGRAQIRELANRLGHPGRGDHLIDEIGRAFDEVKNLARVGDRPLSNLVLHRRGYVFHAGITGEMADLAGFRDAAPLLGVKGAGFVQLEKLVANRPDYLIVAGNPADAEDQGEALLIHPALLKLFPLDRRMVLPDRLTICGGPSTPTLIRQFADEIKAKVHR